jgi:hypothetical protein
MNGRRRFLILAVLVTLCALFAAFALTAPARALPEYSAQTGEPCATCHISPSGGGLRTPRGQAWVGSHRPGTVPALEEALSLLGVHLTVNQADYLAPGDAAKPSEKPSTTASDQVQVRQWLNTYEGN